MDPTVFQVLDIINTVLTTIIGIAFGSQIIYILLFWLKPRKYKEAKEFHRCGIIIAAKDESAVIGRTIEGLLKLNYPKDKYEIFVIAHNCTDKTAEVARQYGVHVYEYNNDKTFLKTEDYIYDTETSKYVRDGYATNTISVSNNVITFDNQIYNEDGSKHNHNIIKYDSNWVKIYAEYGGMSETDDITYNEYYQIIKSETVSPTYSSSSVATYMPNGGGMLTAHVISNSDFVEQSMTSHNDCEATFTYNENEQLTKVSSNINSSYEKNETNEVIEYRCEADITYTTLECDKLLGFLPYYLNVVNAASYYEFETVDTFF